MGEGWVRVVDRILRSAVCVIGFYYPVKFLLVFFTILAALR